MTGCRTIAAGSPSFPVTSIGLSMYEHGELSDATADIPSPILQFGELSEACLLGRQTNSAVYLRKTAFRMLGSSDFPCLTFHA